MGELQCRFGVGEVVIREDILEAGASKGRPEGGTMMAR